MFGFLEYSSKKRKEIKTKFITWEVELRGETLYRLNYFSAGYSCAVQGKRHINICSPPWCPTQYIARLHKDHEVRNGKSNNRPPNPWAYSLYIVRHDGKRKVFRLNFWMCVQSSTNQNGVETKAFSCPFQWKVANPSTRNARKSD